MNFSELTNGTTKDHYNHVTSILVVFTILTSITGVLGIPSNAVVIWIAGVKMKTTVNTIWYVNLAVADLFCCLVIQFLISDYLMDHRHWSFGVALCKILCTAMSLSMFASVFILTLISLDRCAVVVWPVWAQNHRSISRARLLCGLAWFLALLISIPQLIYREICEGNSNRTYCGINNQSTLHVIYITQTVFGFLVPLLVITVCYLLIARKVTVSRFKAQKALTLMVVVVMAFFTCWMPYYTAILVKLYWRMSTLQNRALYPLVFSLGCFNSCLNPVLYVFMGQDFKERVRLSLRHIFENAFIEDFS